MFSNSPQFLVLANKYSYMPVYCIKNNTLYLINRELWINLYHSKLFINAYISFINYNNINKVFFINNYLDYDYKGDINSTNYNFYYKNHFDIEYCNFLKNYNLNKYMSSRVQILTCYNSCFFFQNAITYYKKNIFGLNFEIGYFPIDDF